MGRRHWARARTDASSTEIEASGAFTAAPAWKWSDTLDMRDFTHIALFLEPTAFASIDTINIVVAWSDDGTTVPFDDDDNFQQSDFDLPNFTDGSFNPQPYTATLTLAGGELVADKLVHLVYPVKGGFCRVGIQGDSGGGNYNLRAQRLVR